MSDYYGEATLEDWLVEEVFGMEHKPLPHSVVELFEPWRKDIERNIEMWMDSDDGYGNRLSWRGWGRGFEAVGGKDYDTFLENIKKAEWLIKTFKG